MQRMPGPGQSTGNGSEMNAREKQAVVDRILARAAEQLGDITGLAMARYYDNCPDAKAAFEAHAFGNLARLEGMMIENSLYCLMYWFDSPGEIEIMLGESVLHHNDTLNVPPAWYRDLIEATAEVIAETIPANNASELATWEELRRDLQGLVDNSRQFIA